MSSLLRVSVLLLSLCFAHPALASTLVSGPLTGNTTWTKAESPYVLTGPTTLPAGSTLTIEPGVVVKMSTRQLFIVFGTVNAQGTAAEPIIFTAIADDSVGGDSNGDTDATIPAAGDWLSLYFLEGSSGTFANTEIRYGGATNGATPMGALHNQGGTLTLTDCTITDILNYPIAQESGTTTLTTSTIVRGGSGLRMTDGVFALSGNTFTDTPIQIDPRVDFQNQGNNTGTKGFSLGGLTAANLSGTLSHDQTWIPDGLPYVIADVMTIPAARSLTILPGTIVHMSLHYLHVSGTLTSGVSGASERVTFTSPSVTPQPGDWMGITFLPGSHGSFTATDLRYGAHSFGFGYFNGMVMNQGGAITMDDTTLTDAGDAAIHHESGTLAITASTIANAPLGIRVWGGMVEMHDSSLHDLSVYGVYNIGNTAVDATNNWWGAIGGPTHPSNPFGGGVRVSDNVDFGQWLTNEPLVSCVPGTEGCNSSVLFLPGIEASRLYAMDDPNCSFLNCENQLWEPNRNDDVRKLFLNEYGKSTTSYDIYTRDIIDEVNVTNNLPIPDANIYASFIGSMNTLVAAKAINEWEAIPYDWRLSMEDIINGGVRYGDNVSYVTPTNRSYIVDQLESLASHSKTGKVTIIAHSNGGLVTKALMLKLRSVGKEDLVDKIVFVDVPQSGTPQAIGALLHGYDQGLPFDWFGPLLSPETARAFAHNAPVAYNLLPSDAYFTGTSSRVFDPVVQFSQGSQTAVFRNAYGNEIDTFGTLQAFILGVEGRPQPTSGNVVYPNLGNQTLLAQAQTMHQQLDAWQPPASIKVYQIAGWGIDTLATIKYKQGSWFHCLGVSPCIDYGLGLTEDGDGTVVVPSMLAMSTSTENVTRYWMNLQGYNSNHQIITAFGLLGFDHKNILEVPDLLDFIGDTLSSTVKPLSAYTYLSTSTPPSTSDKKLRYFLHSPLSLDLYDDQGNHTGISTTTGYLENHIPGAYYRTFGEVKYITAPASTTLHLVLNGEASGYFTLDVEEVTGDIVSETTSFVDIPTAATTRVVMDFSDGTIANASALRVDEDGDGVTDFSLSPKVGEIVMLPIPKLPLTLTPENKTIILGSVIPALSATLSGFQNGDTATSAATGTPLCTTTATSRSPVGAYPITCTIGTLVSDKYDVTTFVSGTLTIVYKWPGFSQPINDTAYIRTQSLSVFKGGSTVPVKFQLKNANGSLVSASSAPLFLAPQKGSAMSAAVDESTYSDPGTSGTTFKYDPTAQQYLYNWSTKGFATGYWYKLSAKLDDGTIRSVVVGIR